MNKREWLSTLGVNEQSWLEHAYDALSTNINQTNGYEFPAREGHGGLTLTYGFPKGRGRAGSAAGATYHRVLTDSDGNQRSVIMLHPREWTTPINVLTKLLHEMIHIRLPRAKHHHYTYTAMAGDLGFDTTDDTTIAKAIPLQRLTDRLNQLVLTLPPFPKSNFDPNKLTKSTTRLELYECQCTPSWHSKGPTKIRHAGRTLDATCNRCNQRFERKVKQ